MPKAPVALSRWPTATLCPAVHPAASLRRRRLRAGVALPRPGPLVRVKITRRFIEDIWRISFSEPAVRKAIADRAAELATLGARTRAAGQREAVLDYLAPGAWTNVPV
jgi:hypothetical protein